MGLDIDTIKLSSPKGYDQDMCLWLIFMQTSCINVVRVNAVERGFQCLIESYMCILIPL